MAFSTEVRDSESNRHGELAGVATPTIGGQSRTHTGKRFLVGTRRECDRGIDWILWVREGSDGVAMVLGGVGWMP